MYPTPPDPASTTVLANMDINGVELPNNSNIYYQRCIKIVFSFRSHIWKFEEFHPIS
jgi:hypothetical protein